MIIRRRPRVCNTIFTHREAEKLRGFDWSTRRYSETDSLREHHLPNLIAATFRAKRALCEIPVILKEN